MVTGAKMASHFGPRGNTASVSRRRVKSLKMTCVPSEDRSALVSAQSDQYSLSAHRNLGSLATHWANNEDRTD